MKKKKIWLVSIILGAFVITYAEVKVILWYYNSQNIKKEIDSIYSSLKIEEIYLNKEDYYVNPPQKKVLEDPYWDYVKLPLISVDFSDLKTKNSDTVAFIKVSGTNINYPVVKTTNNTYYLTHTYNKENNPAGWVFMDYRNDINNLDDNTIIYAHSMYDKTMFGSLKKILTNNWYQDTDNYVINISTEKSNTLWQVFSVYSIPTETYYLTSNFGSVSSHEKFIKEIQNRSVFDFKTTVDTNDKILTLSTCKNDFEKIVLHAKLIKEQTRA